MNALVRASAVMSNGPFILNLDCDHYVYNSQAMKEGICFMMDRGGDMICYVQFPQRFEGIDPCDRYANKNIVFFDVNMRALDGLMGPFYVGTGCLFRRVALYGFEPPRWKDYPYGFCLFGHNKRKHYSPQDKDKRTFTLVDSDDEEENEISESQFPKWFGESELLVNSIKVAEEQGLPLGDHPSIKNGRPRGDLTHPRKIYDEKTLDAAINVISCWFEDKTQWGNHVGWVYGSITEDVVSGYKMHNRGWKSVYCVTKRDAFRGTAPINLTDRLHQVLRWATGSIEIFFSRNNALFASPRMKLLQRIAYLNVGTYPFTSLFLVVYCLLPAVSLFSGQFIVHTLNVTYLTYVLIVTATHFALSLLEIKWSGIELDALWKNKQFWLISGTSSHIIAVLHGVLNAVAGIDISFNVTAKSANDDDDDDEEEFADLYIVKWTPLMIPPITILIVNLIAIPVGIGRAIYSVIPQWSHLLGGVFFGLWVFAHLYPFVQGIMGRRVSTIVFLWYGLIALVISLLYVAINPPFGAIQLGGSHLLKIPK
ncbi:Cellulose synthase [Corchorus olitorius]|uniref:Cellulose synthase n=1 Tax=Corchorus olitorius TaxID=93759 RepID=A0A1R3KP59_9ROSI|nr:Cellulose synthase [Corchorus olitorius]